MAKLRRLYGYTMLELQDVLAPKEIKSPYSLADLTVKEGIVVRAPVNLSDVEVAGEAEVPTEAAQMFPLQRLAVDAGTNFGQSF